MDVYTAQWNPKRVCKCFGIKKTTTAWKWNIDTQSQNLKTLFFFLYCYYLQQLHAKAVNFVMKVKAIDNQNTNTRMHIEHFRTGVLDRYIQYDVL